MTTYTTAEFDTREHARETVCGNAMRIILVCICAEREHATMWMKV
jgi:hypothetical protein